MWSRQRSPQVLGMSLSGSKDNKSLVTGYVLCLHYSQDIVLFVIQGGPS